MKKINLFAILSMVFAVSACFVSCDKDDEGDDGGVSPNGGKVVKEVAYYDGYDDGYKYTYTYSGDKVSKITYYYKDELEEIIDISGVYGKSNEMTIVSSSIDETTVKTNERGYISLMKWSDEGGDIETYFEYDSNDFLTKITFQEDDEYGDSYYEAIVLAYTDGNLVSAKLTHDKNEKEYYKTITFKTSPYENRNGVLNPSLEESVIGFLFHYAGLLGKPTKNLISSAQIQYTGDNETETIEYTYSFNSDGDIISSAWTEWSEDCKITYGY